MKTEYQLTPLGSQPIPGLQTQNSVDKDMFKEKQDVTYKGTPIRISADFSTETLQARREWQEIFKVLKGKNMQPRILCPARISFKIEGEEFPSWHSG